MVSSASSSVTASNGSRSSSHSRHSSRLLPTSSGTSLAVPAARPAHGSIGSTSPSTTGENGVGVPPMNPHRSIDGMPQIVDHAPDEIDERWPQAVQSLEHNCCARSELIEYLRGVDLVRHFRAEAGGSEVTIPGHDFALLGHPDERRAYPALSEQLVDVVGREQVAEVAG